MCYIILYCTIPMSRVKVERIKVVSCRFPIWDRTGYLKHIGKWGSDTQFSGSISLLLCTSVVQSKVKWKRKWSGAFNDGVSTLHGCFYNKADSESLSTDTKIRQHVEIQTPTSTSSQRLPDRETVITWTWYRIQHLKAPWTSSQQQGSINTRSPPASHCGGIVSTMLDRLD